MQPVRHGSIVDNLPRVTTAYYWVTQAQRYIQSLGFGTGKYPPVNKQSQRLPINQYGQDNSFASDHPVDELRFGKGGVDDAEDAEVILHEYGHAIHFSQNFSFASEEAGRSAKASATTGLPTSRGIL